MKRAFTLFFLISLLFAKVDAQVYNPVNYHFNGTPTHGVKIVTNLPFTDGSQMPNIIIEGYSYGNKSTIGLSISWYIYGGNFYNPTASSFGGYTPTIKLANENSKVVIFIDDKNYYNRFTVRAFEKGRSLNDSHFEGWVVKDEALGGSNHMTVPYKNRLAGTTNFPQGVWSSDGKLGVGTIAPTSKLHVYKGNSGATPYSATTSILESNSTDILQFLTPNSSVAGIMFGDPDHSYSGYIRYNHTDNSMRLYTSASARLTINEHGSVGIGTTEPTYGKLHINTGSFGDRTMLAISTKDGTYNPRVYFKHNTSSSHQYLEFTSTYSTGTGYADFIFTNGNVGIGTTSPDAKLTVNGDIKATRVDVVSSIVSDFVFEEDYNLRSLEEVEAFVKKNKHLPEIPAASELIGKTYSVGEMDDLLLRKVEELTLYIIEMEKRIQQLEQENNELKQQ